MEFADDSGSTVYGFESIDCHIMNIFESREASEMFMQWGLDKDRLSFKRFRFFGGAFNESKDDYDNLIKALLQNKVVLGDIGISGEPCEPLKYDICELNTKFMTMELFDRLKDSNIISDNGSIRGCFNEVYDGVSVDDLLNDLFVNPDSDNIDLFNNDEKNELLYQLMRIFVLGGEMSQPETNIERYLKATKDLYKSTLTVYRSEDKGEIVVAGKGKYE